MKFLDFDCKFEGSEEHKIKVRIARGVTKAQAMEAIQDLIEWLKVDYEKIVEDAEKKEVSDVIH